MYRSLGTVDAVLDRMPGGPELRTAIAAVIDATPLRRVHIQHLRVEDRFDGMFIDIAMLLDGAVEFGAPGFPALRILPGSTGDGYTSVRGAVVFGAPSTLTLPDLDMTLLLDTPALRAVESGGPLLVSVHGSFTVDRDVNISASLDGFSLPPFTVANTGLVLELTDCVLDLADDTTPGAITALGFGPEFRGLYARSAMLHWLPQAVFGGAPGLRLNFADVALGGGGASFDVDQSFALDDDGRHILSSSDLAGHLLDSGFELGVSQVIAQLRDNVPTQFSVAGKLRVPFLDTLFAAEFGLRADGDGFAVAFSLAQDGAAAPIDLAAGTLTVDDLQIDGTISDAGFSVEGTLSGNLDLAPLDLRVDGAQVRVDHAAGQDTLEVKLTGVDLGPLGQVDSAALRIVSTVEAGGARTTSVVLEAIYTWADLAARLNLASLPPQFPLPPDAATVTATLSWEDDGSGGYQIVVTFSAEVDDPNSLWRFIPEPVRPEVDSFAFAAEVRYASAAAFSASASSGGFSATLAASISARLPALPDLPGTELITITTGGADRVVEGTLEAGVDTAGTSFLHLTVADPVVIDIDLPGMRQPEPFLHAEITSIGFDLAGTSGSAAATEGGFTMSGTFAVRPIDPPIPAPLASHLRSLLDSVTVSDLGGTTELALRFKDGDAALTLDGTFSRADIDVDVFDMLGGLASGLGIPSGADEPKGAASLDVEVGIGLRGVGFTLGSLDAGAPGGSDEAAALELRAEFRLAGIVVPIVLRLSDRELALGLDAIDIPLRPPKFPLTAADIAALTTDAAWQQKLADIANQIAALPINLAGLAEAGRLGAQLGVLQQLFAIRQQLAPGSLPGFEDNVQMVLGVLDGMTGLIAPASDIALALRGIQFVFPFADPRDIRIEGGAHLTGFAADDPFKALEGIELGLGISADTLFFSVDSVGSPIPLPDLGRYPGGSVDLSRLTIGYGFTRNSLSITFRGELTLPPQLIEDADTSDVIGAGIVLPRFTRLGFRFDLVPTPGPIPVVPLLEFDLDLRTPGVPALAATDRCEPSWDGLQVQIPGVIQASLKHLAFAPTFGILPIPNARYGGDMVLGNDSVGVTVIVDELFVLAGLAGGPTPTPVPLLADPAAPYFENICVNVRLAGFGINFHLQRPFPTPSPMVLFEVLGLVNDPLMPIDPDGELARCIRASISDAHITVPEPVRAVLPGVLGEITKPVYAEVNLGQLITAVQATFVAAGQALDAVESAGADLDRAIRRLTSQPPRIGLGDILAALPPELRKVRAGGSFAGFDARAVLLLIDAADAARLAAEFDLRDDPPTPAAPPGLRLGQRPAAGDLDGFRPNLSADQGREFRPDDPRNSLFSGIEFAAFTSADLAAIPLHRNDADPHRPVPAGVIVGAYVSVFRRQRFRFLGSLFEDGSFGLVSALDIEPLRLTVAGISVELPFEANGRLVLTGRERRDGFHGSVTASGFAAWTIAPAVLRVEVGSASTPVRAEIRSSGAFTLQGSGRVLLWNGAVEINGSIDVSETHCFIDGAFTWRTAAVSSGPRLFTLALAVSGRIGPGTAFELGGAGSFAILGVQLLDVEGTVSDRGASVHARIDSHEWSIGGVAVPCRIKLGVRGEIDLARRSRPRALLEGDGAVTVFGAKVTGRGGVRASGGSITMYAEGALRWHGRDWLSGRVELGTNGVALDGHATLALDLTPSNLAGIELAHLFFKLDIAAGFRLDTAAGLARFDIKGSWALGASAAGTSQLFPLAAQRIDISGSAVLELELINISGFSLIPLRDFGDLTLPLPVFQPSTPPDMIKFGHGPSPVGDIIGLSWNGFELGGDINDSSGHIEGRIPLAFTAAIEDVPVALPVDLSSSFRLALVWHDNRLRLKVTRGSQVRFHPL
jgi:hypothetical protein